MHIFCSKALADALNIKKNELQKMPVDAQIDELYAWHGHIVRIFRVYRTVTISSIKKTYLHCHIKMLLWILTQARLALY